MRRSVRKALNGIVEQAAADAARRAARDERSNCLDIIQNEIALASMHSHADAIKHLKIAAASIATRSNV